MRQSVRWRLLAAALLALLGSVFVAQGRGESLNVVSRSQFRADLARMMQLVGACNASAKGCDAKAVGADERVAAAPDAPEFTMRWGWLRDALTQGGEGHAADHAAFGAPVYDRGTAMHEAYAHLQEIAGDVATGPATAGVAIDFATARAEANEVLARKEFEGDAPPSWWERKWSSFLAWLDGLVDGFDRLGEAAPWLGRLVEVLLYLGVAVGLFLLVRRAFARQRLAVSLGAGAGRLGAWDRDAADWAQLAESCAARQQWREAVHCLYWAAIVRLESRRAWRHNPTRTPREYVRLLKPGSPQQAALRSLTQLFERIWYGLREADGADYQRARGLFDGLSGAGSDAQSVSTAESA